MHRQCNYIVCAYVDIYILKWYHLDRSKEGDIMTTFTFRIDENLKAEMKKVCKELGMDSTTAFTIFAKKLVREKRIPFEVSVNDFNSETKQAILEAKQGIGLSKPYTDVNEMFEDILND